MAIVRNVLGWLWCFALMAVMLGGVIPCGLAAASIIFLVEGLVAESALMALAAAVAFFIWTGLVFGLRAWSDAMHNL